jgi:uncharacterized protein CbrC (UPF0167 family)
MPNAYDLGLFSKETFTCEICNTEQSYRYIGPLYMENEKSTGTFKVTDTEHKICAYCIENGSAAEKLNADFKDIDILEQTCYNQEHIDEEKCDSVINTWLYKTPNFKGLETELWPICCSNFTSFIGYLSASENFSRDLNLNEVPSALTAKLEGETVENLFQNLEEAMEIEAKRLRENRVKVKNGKILSDMLKDEESNVVGYLFKCFECDKYRVHIDFVQKV